jgi:MFS superfamily sulfate permease-like transporter
MLSRLIRQSVPVSRSWFTANEWSGAFGDLGTLVPFLLAFVVVAKVPASGVLFTFGAAMVATALVYRTPFPVQPMKAIGTLAATQVAAGMQLGPEAFQLAAIMTGLVWLLLAASGIPRRLSAIVSQPVAFGIVLGLGIALMLDAVRLMAGNWWVAAPCLLASFILLSKRRFPVMALLLVAGVCVGLLQQPTLSAFSPAPGYVALQLPTLHLPTFDLTLLGVVAVALVLPQLPLTYGNAVIAIVEENNRLFPERPVSQTRVAASTGVMNVIGGLLGGVPMCHGAGGMAGHVRFGAQTAGAPLILGLLLTVAALFAADAVTASLAVLATSVLGVILFLAGSQLALGACGGWGSKDDRFLLIVTAAFALWNVGVAFLAGLILQELLRRKLIEL